MSGTFSSLHCHIVFAVKGRARLLHEDWRPQLFAYMAGVLKGHDVYVIQIGGTADHIHALVGLKPKHAVSELVRTLKIASGNWIRDSYHPEFKWQDGYGAFSVSRDQVETVRIYVANQEEPHDSRTEFLELCQRYGIEADERYVE